MKSESRILFEYPDYQVEIEWNGSATYNVFNGGKNVNCFTDYSAKTREQAQIISDEADRLGHKHVEFIPDQSNIPARLKEIAQADDIIITMGAGNIWRQCKGIYEAIQN